MHEGESMEIAGDEPTRAFAGHFAGTTVPVDEDDDGEGEAIEGGEEAGESSFEDGDGSADMEEATSDFTMAFAAQQARSGAFQPALAAAPVAVAGAGATKPRFSVMVRQEDAEDEEILRELARARAEVAPAPALKAVGFGGVPSSEEEDSEEEDGEAMDETTALDGLISAADVTTHDDSDDDLFDESMMDATTDMQDATTYGGILAPTQVIPTPVVVDAPIQADATPSEPAAPLARTPEPEVEVSPPQGVLTPSTASARLQAALFARQSLAASQNAAAAAAAAHPPTTLEPPRSPRRVSVSPTPQLAPKSASRATSPAPTPVPLAIPAPPKSPARSRASLAPPPLPPKSPSAPRFGSPLKASYVNPPSSDSAAALSTPPRPATPQRAQAGAAPAPTTPKSASRVALPPSTPGSPRVAFGTAITPRSGPGALALGSTFTPKVVGAKSPGAGLVSKPQIVARSPRKSLAPRMSVAPVAQVAAPPAARVEEMREVAVGEAEDDLTGSSFGVYNDEPAPLEPLSLDAFFDQTGTGFAVKDILGMTGIDLSSTSAPSRRRKSMAAPATAAPGAGSGPPSFADLAVAGGCRSLFHQLYSADQEMLEREIRSTMSDLAAWDAQLAGGVPRLFEEWARASEGQKETMRSQFREIKTKYYLKGRVEWNEYRAENYAAILGVMEDNLAGLEHDAALVAELQFGAVLPELEARRAALLGELHAERARDLELSACDPAELAQLHADVDEQATALDVLENAHAEAAGRLAALDGQADELREARGVLEREAEALQRGLEEGRCFTKAEVFRLGAEYEALQELHGWRMDRFGAGEVTMTHFDVVQATFELERGLVKAVAFALLPPPPTRVPSPPALAQLETTLTQFLFSKLSLHVSASVTAAQPHGGAPLRPLLHRTAALWTNARRLLAEARQCHLRHPTLAQPVGLAGAPGQELRLCAEVHSAAGRVAVYVVFELTGEELVGEGEGGEGAGREEEVLGRVGSEVVVKWGRADVEGLKYVVRERLDGGGRGGFVGACDEVEVKAGEGVVARA